MRIAVFGANGPTGRLLVEQALDAGHQVAAATRRPQDFEPAPGLAPVAADVFDAEQVEAAITGCEAVLSVLGTPFTRQPITVYSAGAANIVEAMRRQSIRRLAVVSSTAVEPGGHHGSWFLRWVLEPFITRVVGKTTYDDMRRMEALVGASDLDWTIVRSVGLFDADAVSDYQLTEGPVDTTFLARCDLAASLLRQLTEDRYIRKTVSVATTDAKPSLLGLIGREAVSKKQSESVRTVG